MSTNPSNPLPELSDEQYAALKEDIRKRGILVPVEKDENGAILDGFHRDRIARETGPGSSDWPVLGWVEQERRGELCRANGAAYMFVDPSLPEGVIGEGVRGAVATLRRHRSRRSAAPRSAGCWPRDDALAADRVRSVQ